jgi:hypothetical protein
MRTIKLYAEDDEPIAVDISEEQYQWLTRLKRKVRTEHETQLTHGEVLTLVTKATLDGLIEDAESDDPAAVAGEMSNQGWFGGDGPIALG